MVRVARFAAAAAFVAASASIASAQQFNGGIPAGWVCTGNCGTAGADGDVTLAPNGGTQYGWVSTLNGVPGVNLGADVGGTGNPTNGSSLRSIVFTANSGDILSFKFNYITSDGAGFADYAWARLLSSTGNPIATIFTARTTTEGPTVPGFAMPPLPPNVQLDPATVTINPGAPDWSPLGPDSGDCFDVGCGFTGWVTSMFTVGASGQFMLEFGVTNWNDEEFQSGLAFDGLSLNGEVIPPGPIPPPTTVPEPATILLVASGLVAVRALARRRRAA